ncbi:AAEL017065-PA [Aedes aegypti]|uniref:AAEL017065-PA n=2 Tax=Aedes aegypti TaxID=7159 RepID=A0A1S7UF11_AEDAE|nr:AAEL017065-PA [Aedes aegypti]DAA80423.1 TPA_exp: odorant receptor 92 [Aedes aegypti]
MATLINGLNFVQDWLSVKWRIVFSRLWYYESNTDVFYYVNFISMISGIHYKSQTKWKQLAWKVYHNFAITHFLIPFLSAVEIVIRHRDAIAVIWCGIVFFIGLAGCAHKHILCGSYKTILEVRKFIKSGTSSTSDPEFDCAKRRTFFRVTQTISLVVIFIIIMDELLSPAVVLHDDRYFNLPTFLCVSNLTANRLLRCVYLVIFIPIWVSKAYVALVETTALVAGCRSELTIFAKAFEEFLNDTIMNVETESHDVFWESFKVNLRYQVKHHISHIENQCRVNKLLSEFFMVTYYRDVIVIGAMIFIIFLDGLSARSAVIVLSFYAFFAECWWWSILSEFSENINSSIEEHLIDLLIAIPYSRPYHSDYQQTRTTLLIMKIITSDCTSVKYAGVFDVNIQVFSQLVNISYSLLTFLLQVDI